VGISWVLEIIGHFLFKGEHPWDRPIWSWLHTITCFLTQGKRIYMVYGLGSQWFSRYWSTLRGRGPFRMVMISIPSNAPCHKEHKEWRSQQFLRYWDTSCLWGMGPRCTFMTYIPSDATWHKKQEYIWFGVGISMVFEILEHFLFMGNGTTP
jgi:hypothetical protein